MTMRSGELAIAGSMRKPLLWLAILAILTPAAVLGIVVATARETIPPAALALIGAVIALGALWVVFMLRRLAVRIDGDALVVHAGVATKRFALAALRAHGVRVVGLDERTELRPVLRTWGIGLPGLSAGWFRLRSGERAFCLLTGRERVVVLRADDGTRVLLSLVDAAPLRAAIETAAR